MNGAQEVSVAKLLNYLDLKNLIDDIDLKARKIECSDVNRPALQLLDTLSILSRAEYRS